MGDYGVLLDCVSECCNAPTNSDTPICSDCKEWCSFYYEKDLEENEESS